MMVAVGFSPRINQAGCGMRRGATLDRGLRFKEELRDVGPFSWTTDQGASALHRQFITGRDAVRMCLAERGVHAASTWQAVMPWNNP